MELEDLAEVGVVILDGEQGPGRLAPRVSRARSCPRAARPTIEGAAVPREHARASTASTAATWTMRIALARGRPGLERPRWLVIGALVRLPGARDRVRDHRLAHAAVRDPAPARGRPGDRPRRLLQARPDRGQRRVRRAGQRVQLDGRSSSSRAWRSSSASGRACRRRSAASASRSPRASTASACWRSSCRPRSTASRRACGRATIRRAGEDRLQEVAATGDPDAYERVLHAAEAAALDAGPDRRDRARPAPARWPRRSAAPTTAARSASCPSPAATAASRAGERELFSYLTNQAVGVGRERRPARDRAAPGRHRRADRAVQPPPLPGGDHPGGRARAPLRPGDGPDHARHRQLQARQRHLRPPPGRHGAARGGARPAPVLARDRRAGALRRRGDGGRAAADRPRGRVPVRRARAAADRGARPAAARTATGR